LHDLEMINNQCSNIVSSQVFGGALNGWKQAEFFRISK
jgi:hypothetical protein